MTPNLEQAIKQLVQQYGTSILSEPKRLQVMLQDTYNGNRREIRLMMTIVEEGILTEFLNNSSQQVEKQMFARLSNKLHYDTGMDPSLIEDVLTSWIHILDKTPPPRIQQTVVTQPSSSVSIPVQQASATQPLGSSIPTSQPKAQTGAAATRSVYKQNKQQSIPIWKLVIAVVIAVGLIKLFTPWLDGGSSKHVSSGQESTPATTTVSGTGEEKSDQESSDTSTTDGTTSTADTATDTSNDTQNLEQSVSYEQMSSFMNRYGRLGVDAINTNNFSLVEPLLDKSGKSYTEQSDYIAYLNRKGIREQAVNQEVRKVTKIDSTTYEVKTYESYNIYYNDGTGKFKSFNSSYTVKVINGQLAVRSLDKNDEVEARDL